MTNRRLLAELRKLAEKHKDKALVHWYSISDDDKQYHNLTEIRVIVLAKNMVHIMPGTIARDSDGDQYVLFSSKGLCRIRNGRRRGMFVEPHRLRVGEEAGGTGLVKPLKNGPRFNSFHMNDERDAAVVERLYHAYEDSVLLDGIVMPETYIRGRNQDNLIIRLNGETIKKLMDLDGYKKNLAMEDNFHNLINEFSVRNGAYRLYPFNMVQGNGMVVVDVETLPPPLLVPLKALDEESKLARIRL